MVKTPKMRHSKTRREPVTIDLDPTEVSRVEAPASEPSDDAVNQDETPDIQEASTVVSDPVTDSETTAAETVESANEPVDEPVSAAETANRSRAEPDGYGFDADDRQAPREAPEPKPRETAPLPPPSAPAKRGGVSAIAAGIIGGIIALAGGGALQFAGVLGAPGSGSGGDNAAVTALQAEVTALKQEIAGLKAGGGDVAGLSGSLDQVKADLAALKTAVEQGGAGDGAAVAALDARIKELETSIAGLANAGGSAADVAAINDKITGVESQIKAATDAVAASDGRLATLEQSVASLTSRVDAQAAQPKVALAIATSALKQALERGGPFAAELETFAAIAPNAPEIAALRVHAEKGVSTRADLQAEMPEAAKVMIAAALPVDENAGFFQRLLSSAESLVTVRPIGEVAGAGVPETLARMEVAVNAGDLAKAVSEYETLPDTAKAAGKDFADRVKARLEVEKLVDQAIAGAMKA